MNKVTKEELSKQAKLKAYVYCENCGYATDYMEMKDLLYKVCMEGGYIQSDKEGGYYSQCPNCEDGNLSIDYY